MTSIPHSAHRPPSSEDATRSDQGGHTVDKQNSSDDTRPLLHMRDVDIAFGGKKHPNTNGIWR